MKLEDLPSGARIFVDANILIYHFSGISLECRAFLQRCESRQVEAFTGVHILLEITHRLMVLEALQKGLITGGQPARKLKEQPEIIKGLHEYNPTATSVLALCLTPLFVREIRTVIAPLDPGHAGEDFLNGQRAQGQDDRQHSPQLCHGEGRSFFFPSGFSGAREKNAPASSSAYGGATRDISVLHNGPYPVRFSLLRSIVPRPTAHC